MKLMPINISESEFFLVPWDWLKEVLEMCGEFDPDYDEFMNNHSFEEGKELLQLAQALGLALTPGEAGGWHRQRRPHGSAIKQLMLGGMD